MTTVSEQFDVGGSPSLNVKIQAGRVDVNEGPPGRITLDIETRDPESVEIHQSGDTVFVSDNRSGWVVRGTVRVTATVPPRTDVEVGSASADIYVDTEVGGLVVRTASGDLNFRDAQTVEVKTASGNVRGERVDRDLRVNSASGDIWIGRVGGRLTAALASGDVRTDEVAGDLRANSASGDVRIDRFRGDEVTIKSVSGDLVIGFPKGIRLEAEINTLSGDVQLPPPSPPDPPVPPSPGQDQPRWEEKPKRRVRLSAKTVSGDIRITTFSD
ncbi:MAG: DUF4097 family beta strand repeat-containing protein [Acidimicrobiia bacterium]|nr:DUF4097 family beta strand repeat-containing protein [Acidimicrobiia bacterium]